MSTTKPTLQLPDHKVVSTNNTLDHHYDGQMVGGLLKNIFHVLQTYKVVRVAAYAVRVLHTFNGSSYLTASYAVFTPKIG